MESANERIIAHLKEKSVYKQDVYDKTVEVFSWFKAELEEVQHGLGNVMHEVDNRVKIDFSSESDFEAQAKVAGDVLVFHMHSNIFQFDRSHTIWSSSFVQDQPLNAYCGMINVYNFLADSLHYNRVYDSGYLVARIFIGKDGHFFVEGKRQLGFLYNNYGTELIDRKKVRDIIESIILYAISFDLLTPSYDNMKEVTVNQLQELTRQQSFRTGKRLGFQFEADSDQV